MTRSSRTCPGDAILANLRFGAERTVKEIATSAKIPAEAITKSVRVLLNEGFLAKRTPCEGFAERYYLTTAGASKAGCNDLLLKLRANEAGLLLQKCMGLEVRSEIR